MKKNSIIIITIFMIFMMVGTNIVKAEINVDNFKPDGISSSDVNIATKKVNPIIGTIKVVGIIIAFITLSVIGFKYMIGSVEEKAEYKKTMIPYIIGVVLLVTITILVELIAKVITNIS